MFTLFEGSVFRFIGKIGEVLLQLKIDYVVFHADDRAMALIGRMWVFDSV